MTKIDYGNGKFLMASANAVYLADAPYTDSQWILPSLGGVPYGIGIGPEMFLAVGQGTVFASTNGTNWITQSTGDPSILYDVVFDGNTLVAVGENGTILQSGPFSPKGLLEIKDPVWRNGVFETSVQTEAGSKYILEFKDILSAPSWQPAASVQGDGTLHQLSDTQPSAQSRFYRLRTQ